MSKKLTCHCIALTTKIKEEFSNSAPVKRPLLTSLDLLPVRILHNHAEFFHFLRSVRLPKAATQTKTKPLIFLWTLNFRTFFLIYKAIKTSKRAIQDEVGTRVNSHPGPGGRFQGFQGQQVNDMSGRNNFLVNTHT